MLNVVEQRHREHRCSQRRARKELSKGLHTARRSYRGACGRINRSTAGQRQRRIAGIVPPVDWKAIRLLLILHPPPLGVESKTTRLYLKRD